SSHSWIPLPKRSKAPLPNAVTVFTDAGRKSRRAAMTWQEQGQWHHVLIEAQEKDSLQTLELTAIVHAFSKWIHEPLNVLSDSLYAVGIAQRIEDALLRDTQNPRLGCLF
ncbi:POK19 protein, partial [Irena cyanogastra]|nr:POK19 protein [Irena cyanogastra]